MDRKQLLQHFEALADTPVNPNGIPASSPGLRATSYPGNANSNNFPTPTGLRRPSRSTVDTTPLELKPRFTDRFPRVGAQRQPWALGLSPVGAGDNTAICVFSH